MLRSWSLRQTRRGSEVTVYFGPVEIRHFGLEDAEQILLYPHDQVRIEYSLQKNTEYNMQEGAVSRKVSYLSRDQLGSVRSVIGGDGAKDTRSVYRPFGEQTSWKHDLTATDETKGFLGERYDEDAGLQYLNARYYDPRLAMFLQPDWYEVTKAGVGTNRYAYSFNDPVNKRDPGGNCSEDGGNDGCEITGYEEDASIDRGLPEIDPRSPYEINKLAIIGDGTRRRASIRTLDLHRVGEAIQRLAEDRNSQLGKAIAKSLETGDPVSVDIAGIKATDSALQSANPMNQKLGVGRTAGRMIGTVSTDQNGNWELNGDLRLYPDEQDYPNDSARGTIVNAGNNLLGWAQKNLGGKDYTIDFQDLAHIVAGPYTTVHLGRYRSKEIRTPLED